MRHSDWSFYPRSVVERVRKCDGANWQEKKAAYREMKRLQDLESMACFARQNALAMDIGLAVLGVMAHRRVIR